MDPNKPNMAEKENFESASHKIGSFQPTLTSKPSAVHLDARSLESASSSPAGYYQNVAQKGKLYLPKALWVLLIIGGLCFLALMSSLNKSMNSLDTLIELEREQIRGQKHSASHQHLDEHQITDKSNRFKLKSESESWPEMADSAALQSEPGEEFGSLKSMLDRIFKIDNLNENPDAHVERQFIISSNMQPFGFDSPIDTIAKMMGEKPELDLDEKSKDSPMISAHIDKVNININPPQDPTPAVAPQLPFAARPEAQLINDLPLVKQDLDEEIAKLLKLAISNPVAAQYHPASFHHSELAPENLSPEGVQSPFKAIKILPFKQLFGPMNVVDSPQVGELNNIIPPMFGRPKTAKFIAPFAKDLPPVEPPKVPELPLPGKFMLSPAANPSPYELIIPHKPEVQPEFKLDLGQNLLDDLMLPGKPFGEDQLGDNKRIVIIKTQLPMADSEFPKLGGELEPDMKNGEDTNQVKELFNMFFGPPPDSKLVVAPTESQPIITEPKPVKVEDLKIEPAIELSDSFKDTKVDQDKSQSLSEPLLESEDGQKEVEHMIEGLFGTMFSLPQMGQEQNPVKVQSGLGK